MFTSYAYLYCFMHSKLKSISSLHNKYTNIMMKSIKTHAKSTIWFILKKYKIETFCFIISLLIVTLLELTTWRIKINTTMSFTNLNNLIVILLSSYVASYIFWFTNALLKYKKDIINIYPHLSSITRNMLSVYDMHIRGLKVLHNDFNDKSNFVLNKDNIEKINKYASENPVRMASLCGENYLIAMQIFFDIDLLLKFTPYLDTALLSKLMQISRNTFITQHKNEIRKDLSLLDYTAGEFIRFSESMEDLRNYAKHEFYD